MGIVQSTMRTWKLKIFRSRLHGRADLSEVECTLGNELRGGKDCEIEPFNTWNAA